MRAARSFTPAPAVVIGSGSGSNCHAYWPLREPLAPAQAEAFNLRLAHALGADRACFDASRILRPPGSWNHKHQPPRPVTVITMQRGLAFDAREVAGHLPQPDAERLARRWQPRPERDTRGDPLLAIEPATYVANLIGVRPGRDHKVRCPFHSEERPSLHVYPTAARGLDLLLVRPRRLDLRPGRGTVGHGDARQGVPRAARAADRSLHARAVDGEGAGAATRARSRAMTTLLTVQEVAERLGVSKDWVWAQARAGLIPHVQLGRYRRFREEALDQWLREREEQSLKH